MKKKKKRQWKTARFSFSTNPKDTLVMTLPQRPGAVKKFVRSVASALEREAEIQKKLRTTPKWFRARPTRGKPEWSVWFGNALLGFESSETAALVRVEDATKELGRLLRRRDLRRLAASNKMRGARRS